MIREGLKNGIFLMAFFMKGVKGGGNLEFHLGLFNFF